LKWTKGEAFVCEGTKKPGRVAQTGLGCLQKKRTKTIRKLDAAIGNCKKFVGVPFKKVGLLA